MDRTRSSTRHTYTALSPLSAAQPLVEWINAHGRWPTDRECRNAEGLLAGTTYYRYFQASTFSQVVTRAYEVLEGRPASGWVMELPRMRRLKPCLGECGTQILDEGAHLRFCRRCRERLTNEETLGTDDVLAMPEPVLTRQERQHARHRAPWSWYVETQDLMEL